MLSLRIAYVAAALILTVLFGFLYDRGMVPYAAINILFIVISPMAYVFAEIVAYALIFVSWLVIYPLLVFIYRVDPLNASVSLVIFNILIGGYLWYRNVERRQQALCDAALKELSGKRDALSAELDAAVRFENGMRSKELSIVNLYEITKKMSEYLRFEDIFDAFSLFMKENFTFRKCDLLILNRAGDKLRIERAYRVWQSEPAAGKDAYPIDHDRLIDLFSGGFKDVYLTKAENGRTLKALGLEEACVESFVALPLLSERKMVGILAVENLPKVDLEQFVILAMQFSLELKKVLLYEMVEKLAITDSLTGLYIRRYFYERMEEELQRSKRYQFELTFLMIDIDDFKKCNDTYGHLVGDVVIKDIARIIKENVREIDIVGRYGGEEFSVVLPETGHDSAHVVAERLRKKVEGYVFSAYDEKLKLTISIGFAISPSDGVEMKDIIERADEALYKAKKLGKNVVCEYKR